MPFFELDLFEACRTVLADIKTIKQALGSEGTQKELRVFLTKLKDRVFGPGGPLIIALWFSVLSSRDHHIPDVTANSAYPLALGN